MSGHRYMSNTSNRFTDDDDTFCYGARTPPPQSEPSPSPYITDLERQRQMMLEKQKVIEQHTLDSTFKSISLLRESGKIGIATAEELTRQREQLQNTSKGLDEINTNLTHSQRHLNGIKSVFYGFKNYLSGKSDQTPNGQVSPSSNIPKAGNSSRLDDTINTLGRSDLFESHPTTQLRGFNEQTTAEPLSDTQRINKTLDDNLDEMVTHISRLKGLGMALGEEIEQQNDLIDDIHKKVDDADIKIGYQNNEMNKLIGK